jgi:dimethylhistidine N-methyltransferase
LTESFTEPLDLSGVAGARPRLGFFPGSTLGNFEPVEAKRLLATFRETLGAGARLIVGIDLVKDPRVLVDAYDDAQGVTAAFNLNLLERINRELGAEIDVRSFAHRSIFDPQASRIEMHLVSRRAQTLTIEGRRFRFAAGETIHTENSYKFTVDGFERLARTAGWTPQRRWTDGAARFSVHDLA